MGGVGFGICGDIARRVGGVAVGGVARRGVALLGIGRARVEPGSIAVVFDGFVLLRAPYEPRGERSEDRGSNNRHPVTQFLFSLVLRIFYSHKKTHRNRHNVAFNLKP